MEPNKFTITLTDPEADNGGGTGGVHVVGSNEDYSSIVEAIASEESIDYNQEEAESLLNDLTGDFNDMTSAAIDWMEVGFANSELVLQFTTRVNE